MNKKRKELIGGLHEFNPDLDTNKKVVQLVKDLQTYSVKLPENFKTEVLTTVK